MFFRTARVSRAHEARGDARGPEEHDVPMTVSAASC